MTLQWVSVAAFLYTEIALGILLSLGIVSNARWKSIFSSRLLTTIAHHGTFLFYAFLLMLAVLCADSVWSTYKLSKIDTAKIDLRNNPQAEIQMHMKLFRAQRNLYITGFSLFMIVVLRRLIMLISAQAQLEASNEAAMKQAKGASDQARKLLAENEELMQGNRKTAAASTQDVEQKKKELQELVDTLKEELDDTTNRLETSEKNLAAMKTQSEGLHREYDRVLDVNNALEKKLAALNQQDGEEEKKDN